MLRWYDKEKRKLPWRTIAETEADPNIRGYAIWVSEIMLQQTQVSTVISYYNNWMKKWPTLESLAAEPDLDNVNKVWAGLGYYSRARRLWEGARKVVKDLHGQVPQDADRLERELPGVGRYTASAIASIAFGKKVELVDGNVIRVISRLRKIGADVANQVSHLAYFVSPNFTSFFIAQAVIEALWDNANALVDRDRPGDFNQAMMELGATICTPKNPSCSSCPVQDQCLALATVKQTESENKNKLANSKIKTETADIEDCVPG